MLIVIMCYKLLLLKNHLYSVFASYDHITLKEVTHISEKI